MNDRKRITISGNDKQRFFVPVSVGGARVESVGGIVMKIIIIIKSAQTRQ